MKTLIFKLDRLSKTDLQSIDNWLSTLRWVWNEGLRLIEELDTFTATYVEVKEVEGREKKVYHRAPCCPLPWQYRRIDKNLPWGEGNIAPYTYMARKRPYAPFCPLGQDYREPRLDNPTNFSLAGYFAHKRHPDKPWLKAVPAWFIRGACHSLADAWQRYKSGKGGKPRFKSRNDTADTLIHEDGKTFKVTPVDANSRDGIIRIPRLGVFRVKYLWRDWGDLPIKVLKIAKRPDGYYLQLTGDVPEAPLKPREPICSIAAVDSEDVEAYIDGKRVNLLGMRDDDRPVVAYQPDPALLRRKEKLQQQLSRQTYLGSNWKKTKLKLSRLERRMSLQASNYNQKLTTFLVRTYGAIELDKKVGKQRVLKKPAKRARAKTLDPIHYDPNGAAKIAAYNRSVTSMRGGQFVALLKQKAKNGDRPLVVK